MEIEHKNSSPLRVHESTIFPSNKQNNKIFWIISKHNKFPGLACVTTIAWNLILNSNYVLKLKGRRIDSRQEDVDESSTEVNFTHSEPKWNGKRESVDSDEFCCVYNLILGETILFLCLNDSTSLQFSSASLFVFGNSKQNLLDVISAVECWMLNVCVTVRVGGSLVDHHHREDASTAKEWTTKS